MTELLSDSLPVMYVLFFLAVVFFTVLINKILLKFSTNLGVRNEKPGAVDGNRKTRLGRYFVLHHVLVGLCGLFGLFSCTGA